MSLLPASRGLKSSYKIDATYKAIYTGGRVQVSHDGQRIFCSRGNKVEVLLVQTGKVEKSIEKDGEDITTFIVSPDNLNLVTAAKNGLLHHWDWQNNACTRTWKALHSGPVAKMCFDSTSTLLATGGTDSSVKIWDILKQYCTHHLRGGQGVFSIVEFHPDISRLQIYGAADDNNIRVWDLKTSQVLACLENGHFSQVTSLQFTKNGNHMLSSGRDKVVIMWDVVDFNVVRTIPVYEAVESIVLLPHGREIPLLNVTEDQLYFLTAGSKGIFQIWSSNSGKLVYSHAEEISCKSKDAEEGQLNITQSVYNPETDLITSVTVEHNINMHSLETMKLEKQFIGYNDEILDIKFVGQGESHILTATNSHYLKLFERSTFSCQLLKGHTDIVLCIDVFRKNRNMFVSAGKDNEIRVWRMDPESCLVCCVAVGRGHTLAVGTICCSKTNASFVMSGSQDTTLKMWEIPDKFTDELISLTPKLTEKSHDKDVNSVALSPNDKLIATGSQDKSIKIWNSSEGALLGVMRGHRRGVWCVEFSPVDQVVASSSADGLIKIWSVSTFNCVKTFEGHESSVLKIVFLSRGMQLLSSASDGLVKLWNIKQNECINTLDEHDGKIWALAVTSNEENVMTGADDSNMILWLDNTESESNEKLQALEQNIEQEQQLSNLLHTKNYVKALGIAISLDRPFRVLSILKELMSEQSGKEKLQDTIKKLRNDQIDNILGYCVKWNTNSKNCHPSQYVLSVILQLHSPDELLKFPNAKAHLEGLIPYSERHLQRMNRLLQQVTFINYTWSCIKMTPTVDHQLEISEKNKEKDTSEEREVRLKETLSDDRLADQNQDSKTVSDHSSNVGDDDANDKSSNRGEKDGSGQRSKMLKRKLKTTKSPHKNATKSRQSKKQRKKEE